MSRKLRVFLIDDEALALRKLKRLLLQTGRVEVVGETTNPLEALATLPGIDLDGIFLDIQMPEMTGFELVSKLKSSPPVIFTTAYDQFALDAFEAGSIDYLLKPVEIKRLEASLSRLQRYSTHPPPYDMEILAEIYKRMERGPSPNIQRIATRVGGRVQFLSITEITHFYAEDKLIFASTLTGRSFPIDRSVSDLEKLLDSQSFLRIHRNCLVNLNFVNEVHGWFSGRVLVRLKDELKTDLVVARDRVRTLKEALNI